MSVEAFVPYSQRAPDTQDLNELRHELALQTALNGRRSSEALEAFQRLFRASAQAGTPLDGLRRYSKVETERFFAQTVNGTEGHVYWTGAVGGFYRNDRKTQKAVRWWWDHTHEEKIDPYADLTPVCGEQHCIAPDHQLPSRSRRRRRFTDEQMIGAIQVYAMRNNTVPSSHEWRRARCYPTRAAYVLRFGTWQNALKAAGFAEPVYKTRYKVTEQGAVDSLLEAKRVLGRWPSSEDYKQNRTLREHLKSKHLTTTPTSIRKLIGPRWQDAIRRASEVADKR